MKLKLFFKQEKVCYQRWNPWTKNGNNKFDIAMVQLKNYTNYI